MRETGFCKYLRIPAVLCRICDSKTLWLPESVDNLQKSAFRSDVSLWSLPCRPPRYEAQGPDYLSSQDHCSFNSKSIGVYLLDLGRIDRNQFPIPKHTSHDAASNTLSLSMQTMYLTRIPNLRFLGDVPEHSKSQSVLKTFRSHRDLFG